VTALAGVAHGAGVARLDLTAMPDSYDPAVATVSQSFTLEYATCAKLVNYPDTDPPGGHTVVPEVAETMPTVSADGRTYTFTVRDGFGFSPPSTEKVTAQTFRFVLKRLLAPAPNQLFSGTFFLDIAGARAYRDGTAADVSGIVATGSTLTITLTAPAGDFLARLALPYTCAIPLSTPAPSATDLIPMAGPYYVAEKTSGRYLLVRNPNYGGTRAARLDRIDAGLRTMAEAASRVESNLSDWTLVTGGGPVPAGSPPPSLTPEHIQSLYNSYGPSSPWGTAGRQRFTLDPLDVVWYLNLNTSRAPFSKPNLRLAVAYAIDRNALAAIHGPYAGVATDEMLSPGLPGFVDDAIYPLGGDMVEAARLAALEGVTPTSRITATMLSFDTSFGRPVAEAVRLRLADIGIDLNVIRPSRQQQVDRMATRGEPFDIGLTGWGADYLDPFNFLDPLFNGSRIVATGNTNTSYFDDAGYNSRLDAAAALTGAARYAEYQDIDVDMMRDAAPAVPYVNTNARHLFSRRVGCVVYGPYTINLVKLCVHEPVRADFVGDAVSDVGVWRPSNGGWYVQGQSNQFWGASSDIAVAGDYNGDGATDRAVWRPASGGWYVQGLIATFRGRNGDLPVPGDYDGDGRTQTAVWRPASGGWYVEDATTVYHGRSGDVPVPGDYDGDGDVEPAVWRPASGGWYVRGAAARYLGRSGDVPVPADYDNDGDDDPAVWRPSNGGWFVLGQPTVFLGANGDMPAPAQYVGDQRAERAVYRPSSGAWYVEGQPVRFLGAAGDHPVAMPPAVRMLLFP
jgi:ABC-type transport system substrate-binding protein